MIVHFTAFLGVVVLVIVTPGPDTALTIRNTLLGGRAAGLATAAGVAAGQAVWALAAAVGIAALVQASQPAFTALRLLGAAYLVFLGLQSLVAAVRGHRRAALDVAARGAGLRPAVALRQGLLSNLANPKMAAFFTSLLPQFVVGPSFAPLFALGLVLCGLTLIWLAAYAVAVARAGDLLRRPLVRRAIDAVTGAVLVALGLRVAADRR
ncbi:MAG TPA: LysE family translocator [Gaiellaceae bacterium]|nr:LysE family translocator [Gaiellaceae bacterium]